jgi:glycosyltransferase involved in cell wall biosynthesis
MRIAVFSYRLPVPGQKRGGIERSAHALAQGLAERGHTVVVFSHDPAPEASAYQVRPLPWRTFVDTWLGRRATMGYLGNVLALLPDYRGFDALIAHGDSLLLPLLGKPVLRVMHGSAIGEAMHATTPGRFVLQCGVFVQELLTSLTTPATVAVSVNARRDIPFIRHTIPHGVDARLFTPMPREKTSAPSIVFVGTLDGRKRGSFLLEIFRRTIRPALPDATLMFVGPEGPEEDGVTYFTGVEDAELARLYRRAWVYASPSTYEGFGLPYLEAMACGTAVVATPNPGSRELLASGENGCLAEDDDFGTAILRLLTTEESRRAYEAKGLLCAQEHSLGVMIDRYEMLLNQMCGVHAGSHASA